MNSQSARSCAFTISPRASTICVCGVIGYAQITSGRHSATASAMAREPSACLSMCGLPELVHDGERRPGRRDVFLGYRAGKLGADRRDDGIQLELPCRGCERAEQRHVRHRAPDVLQSELGCRQQCESVTACIAGQIEKPEVGEAASRIEQHVAGCGKAVEEI